MSYVYTIYNFDNMWDIAVPLVRFALLFGSIGAAEVLCSFVSTFIIGFDLRWQQAIVWNLLICNQQCPIEQYRDH